jgi:hypothetical protein
MKKHFSLRIAELAGLLFLSPLMLSAQFVSSTVWLKIADDVGGHDSLVFGNQWNATYCIDTALGEYASPPWYPSGFWAVFMNIPGRANCFGTLGILKHDLRPFKFNYPAKADTFDIAFENLDSAAQLPGVSVKLQWPSKEYLWAQLCDNMFLLSSTDGVNFHDSVDMFAQDSLVLKDQYNPPCTPYFPCVKLRILKYTKFPPDGVGLENQPFPNNFILQQNFPDPFNPSTSISYSIPKQTRVRLQIFNLLGQLITTLVDESKPSGAYTVTWDASTRPSGVYFYRMTAGEFVQTRKAMVIR